jgi:hypothetical protein
MAQQTEQRQRKEEEAHQQESVTQQHQQTSAISSSIRVMIYGVAIVDLGLIGAMAASGDTSIFAPIYVAIANTYIFGALYIFKRLMDYRPSRS